MVITDIASTDVVTADIEDTLYDIACIMQAEGVGSVVVVDGKGAVAGMLTDRDLVVSGLAEDRDPHSCIANDILSSHVFSVAPDADVASVARQMRDQGVRRVPVMRDGDLVGIVTLDDLLVHLVDEFVSLASVVHGEFPDR